MRRSGLARQTIHFYLRKGLLPKAHRTSRTYALYPPNAIELLDIVKRCQTEFRLSLDEIAKIFAGANYDARRIGTELELRKLTAPPPQEAVATGAEALSNDEIAAQLEPPPPQGWMEELFRCGLVHSDGGKHRAESAELIRSIWELCKLGVKLDDLKSVAKRIEEQTDQELTEFRRALDHKRGSTADYATAVRLFKAVDQFVHWSRKDFLRMAFAKRAYRSRDLFVGPNQKHVFPSETLLAKMGLNREIDRLLNRLDQDSGDKQSLIDLARCYYLRSDWFNLYGVSEKILQLDPLSDRAIADMSRAMYYLGRVDDSVNLLEQRLKNSANPLLKFRLGQCLVLRAKDASVGEFLSAVLQKQQLASEALREARDQPHIRRWILLDIALDNVCLADPLQLNQPAIEELERLHQEYQAISDKSLSTLSKMSLAMGKILAAYALYLVYRRHRHPKAEQLRRKVIQMDPYSVLAARSVKATPLTRRSNSRKNVLKRVS